MAADPLDSLRLTLMQDMLPMGLAAVDRVRKGGPGNSRGLTRQGPLELP